MLAKQVHVVFLARDGTHSDGTTSSNSGSDVPQYTSRNSRNSREYGFREIPPGIPGIYLKFKLDYLCTNFKVKT